MMGLVKKCQETYPWIGFRGQVGAVIYALLEYLRHPIERCLMILSSISYRQIIFLALFVLSGCTRGRSNVQNGVLNQELYVGIGTEPAALDPHLTTGLTEFSVMVALLEGLTTLDPETMKIKPGVARSWDISNDGKTFTFHLDPEARWSNGDVVTADDFLFSFERILTPALGAPYAYMLYVMRGAEAFNKGETSDFSTVGASAPDASTLVIELESSTPYFLSLLTHNTWWPVHPPTILKHGKMTDRISKWTRPENYVGNGPFELKSWRLNHSIVVKKNQQYRRHNSVVLNGIHFLPINNDSEERAFRADQLHMTSTVPTHRLDWYRTNYPKNLRIYNALGVYYYSINTTRPPLDDPRVRKALAYSIDREALTRHVLNAGEQPAYNFTPPKTGGYTARARLSYDPEQARKLLAEAGYPDGKGFPEFELLFNTSEAHHTIAVAIQQMWKKELGINIQLYNQEWKVYLATRQSMEFDIVRGGWFGDYNDAYTFLSLGESENGNNHTGWKDSRYDALLKQSTVTIDPEERDELFQQAEEILIEEMPIIPIYFYVSCKLVDESVQGWHPNILGYELYQDIFLSN
jgi:oligopeptide transport system substrate-binding protein